MDELTRIYPNGMTGEEIIQKITEFYHAGYNLNTPEFNLYEQLLACESLAETEEDERKRNSYSTNGNVSVNGSVNDTYKLDVKFSLTESKLEVISKLNACNFSTPPRKVARLLETFFVETPSKENHWLYVAQNWTPRSINRVLALMIKSHESGRITFQNPAAYFTKVIQYRKKRKSTGINGIRKKI